MPDNTKTPRRLFERFLRFLSVYCSFQIFIFLSCISRDSRDSRGRSAGVQDVRTGRRLHDQPSRPRDIKKTTASIYFSSPGSSYAAEGEDRHARVVAAAEQRPTSSRRFLTTRTWSAAFHQQRLRAGIWQSPRPLGGGGIVRETGDDQLGGEWEENQDQQTAGNQ